MSNYNTGTTGTLTAATHTTAFTFTVPLGVATGDVMILSLEVFTQNGSSNSFGTPSSGGGNWTQIGSTLTGTYTGGGTFPVYGFAFWRVATASDPGSTFTMSYTGTAPSPDQVWWSADLESYTGFYTTAPIGNFVTFNNGNSTTITAPSTTTTAAGSWEVDTCPVAIASSATFATEPLTNRHIANTQGINSSISDSNGSVGAAGTAIGGGNWTTQAAVNNSGMAFTIELLTQAPGAAAAGGGPPLLIPPGLQSPMVLAEPPRFSVPPAPQQEPAPSPAPAPPGLQSPMSLTVPARPATQAPPAPPTGTPAPAPVPPGLQSPMSLAQPVRPATQAPPAPPPSPPTLITPPGLQSPMVLAEPLYPSQPAPPQQQPAPSPVLIPPGFQSPMSLGVPMRPATQAPPPTVVLAQPGYHAPTPPGRLSPMSIGLGLYAPSPGPGIPPPVPVAVITRPASPGDYDGKTWWKKRWILRL